MRASMRKLIAPQMKHLQQTTPTATLAPIPQLEAAFLTPLPTLSLTSPTTQSQLLTFLKIHLRSPITPQTLLHFLKNKLHYHPKFTHLDFHIFQWASTIDAYRHDHHTYEWMIRTLAVSDRFDALRVLVLDIMPSKPCPCSDGIFCCPRFEPIFRFAINSYCRVGRLNDASLAFDIMKKLIDGKPSVAVYNILIHGFVKNSQHDKALRLYDQLILDRVKPDVFTFNILISSYCKSNSFGSALELFKEMRAKSCEPNVVSFNTLIKGFFKERNYEEGVAMAYEMIDMGKRVLPDGFDCSDLFESLCSGSNAIRALEVVEEMWKTGKSPGIIACSTLVEGLRTAGKVEDALRFVNKMLKEGIVLDSVTFNCLLKDASHLGRTAEADRLRLLASSKGLDADAVTYNILVAGYTREGKTKEGELLVEEMLDKDYIPDIASYNRLIDRLHNI
uniref:Pentatricopeptide repeat-containing protein n=1 Tax=Chenopodium quinoa TaxID=63459 RepID=A0A803L0M7_CHEQI